MARPPEFRRFTKEDINPDKEGWIDNLIVPLNTFLEQTYTLFNGNLSLGDNVTGQIVQTSFTTPSDYALGGFPSVLLPWGRTVGASSVQIGYIRNATSPSALILTATSAQWSQTNIQNIRIDYIAGLAASTKYTVRFVIL